VPRGGGTTMSGGVDASGGGERAALIALDMRSMARLVDIDAISLRATFQAGIGGSALDAALAPLGLTVGHQPESFERSTLGGWIAARSIGQASGPAGAVSAVVRAARVATPVGVLETGGAPAHSEGPDLLELVTGSEGVLGAIEQATVLVRPRPEAQTGSALLFRSSADALAVVRLLAQEGTLPEIALLLDETETATLGRPLLAPAEAGRRQIGTRGAERGALLVLIGSGSARVVGAEIDAAVESCLAHGATDIGQEPARRWLHTRFVGPYLRDVLIDAGFACEWISTAATWGTLPAVRDAVVAALTDTLGARSLVSCRLTNAYPDGAGLRFTYIAPVAPGGEIELWRRAQAAAFGAILAEGGAISHGQAIGTHQARWLARARGRTAEGVLMAAKNELDPLGIMNPGKLLHEAI
jgi:alkyldihydroxyacetonephosphate synthase